MTTIAFDGFTLAGDRQSTYGNTPVRTRPKVHRVTAPDGRRFIVGMAGLAADARAYLQWLRGEITGRPPFVDMSAMLIDDARRIWIYNDKSHGYEQIHTRQWAIGSGCDYALGAMAAGADAVAAVKIASRLDVCTGMGVSVLRI